MLWRCMGEWRYTFLTAAADGGNWSASYWSNVMVNSSLYLKHNTSLRCMREWWHRSRHSYLRYHIQISVKYMLRPSYLRKKPPYSIGRRLGRSRSRCARFWEASFGNRNPITWPSSQYPQVAIPTELFVQVNHYWYKVLMESGNSERFKIRVRVTLRLAVYRQSIHLGDELLETQDQ
jgi:hypothetical protein